MKILLAAINAKYIHSNPAVYSLKAYAEEFKEGISIAEFTINHQLDYILQELYKEKPQVLCFSCYIWNINYVTEIINELHKLCPDTKIWVGGPEVSYQTEGFMERNPGVFGTMVLEGEETFLELCRYYHGEIDDLSRIKGILYTDQDGTVKRTPKREPLSMDQIPFYYNSLTAFENRVIYYESSRGCPFSCSYCLSSIDKSLRFRDIELVKKELDFFIGHKVGQVKFVDRTFNCNHAHAMEIWKFIKEHDNGITNFHFEVSADLLTEEEIDFLAGMRRGLIQFEIGVQSINPVTIKEIHRTMNLDVLYHSVRRIQKSKNIHQHLDLIAGLPFEDFKSFVRSFDEIYNLKPEQLQLGFLKVLKGSHIWEHAKEYGMLYHENPPYEILATKWISYEEILKIKMVEEMLEIYYNSGQFEMTVRLLELAFESSFDMFYQLASYYEQNGLSQIQHSRMKRGEILRAFALDTDRAHKDIYEETLVYDLYARERLKKRPEWAKDLKPYKEITRKYCGNGKNVHLEPFTYQFIDSEKRTFDKYPRKKGEQLYLFSYGQKDKVGKNAQMVRLEEN